MKTRHALEIRIGITAAWRYMYLRDLKNPEWYNQPAHNIYGAHLRSNLAQRTFNRTVDKHT
jgi:hypothetical protein